MQAVWNATIDTSIRQEPRYKQYHAFSPGQVPSCAIYTELLSDLSNSWLISTLETFPNPFQSVWHDDAQSRLLVNGSSCGPYTVSSNEEISHNPP